MNRRDFLYLSSGAAAASCLLPVNSLIAAAKADSLHRMPGRIVPTDAATSMDAIKLSLNPSGNFFRPTLTNTGTTPVRIKEVTLFTFEANLPADTPLYGEGFQMLSQITGTLGQPHALGYSEKAHYKIPQPEDATAAATGLLTLSPQGEPHVAMAFTSCSRFAGRFYVRKNSIDAVVDTEDLELAPGKKWQLEEFVLLRGSHHAALLDTIASRIQRNHPRTMFKPVPTGWCSWYCFGPRVTADNILQNLAAIRKDIPQLHYIQIDDGYQPAMGDWLESGPGFGGDVRAVLREIKQQGFEPAIWVAPFIAEAQSHVFQQHPEWFIKDDSGKPLASNTVTFGGWRHGPWYVLDGTNHEVQQHLESVFRTMRNEWGCTYFKLDANFWGAMHGGHFSNPQATRIEAYRQGMQAIQRGAGDAFLLGCNHPIWASFGLIDGSRSSGDIKRTWANFATQSEQTLRRNWQNGSLWWNDPDAVLLTGPLSEDEFQFHATAAYASGGLILSGDDLTKIQPERLAMLKKLLPPTGVAAKFDSIDLSVGRMQLPEALIICAFNREDGVKNLSVPLSGKFEVTDIWTGSSLGVMQDKIPLPGMQPHSARLLKCVRRA